ncbi:MAG TPA: c-type cytochrome [Candidatus Acidoferrum sp.]|nr:c-type cytochrome [Candidatus Acidoferrum sp.]
MNAEMRRFDSFRFMQWVMIGMFALNGSGVFAQNETSAKSRDDKAVYAAIEKVPAKARAKPNPLENDPDALAAGGKLFERHCAECHGMKAEGTRRGPSLLEAQIQQATPGALFWILSNGVIRHGMPDWSKLPEPERWQIVTFLKSLKASAVSQSTTAPR